MLELAQLRDRNAINALAKQIHDLHVNWRSDIYCDVEELYSTNDFQSAIQKRELYVAKFENQTVGFVHLSMSVSDQAGSIPRKIMLVNKICVDENCRGQGIGKAMMRDVYALAKAFRCTNIQLNVYPQNDAAVSFFQRCGLTIQSIKMSTHI